MKQKLFLWIVTILFYGCNNTQQKETIAKQDDAPFFDTCGATNNFYDDAKTKILGTSTIQVSGQVKSETKVNLTELPLRSVIVKETLPSGDSTKFIGAYRYDGYSLFDILNRVKIEKKTKKFNPIIDLFVLVTNEHSDSVVFSWGEIFYPIHRHEIIIASRVMRIVPSKTKELWPLPSEPRIVAGADLLTERNISNPCKIEILVAPFNADESKKGIPLHAKNFVVIDHNKILTTIGDFPSGPIQQTYPTVFYGRGRGIHGVREFHGPELHKVLGKFFKLSTKNIQKGYFIIAAPDDYHGVFTFSEVFNRNDQSSFLLTKKPKGADGRKFAIYPAPDFFSDRAIKAVDEIRFMYIK